jgi:hypothetical protein
MVCFFCTAVSIGVAEVPLCPHCPPEKRDELAGPDCAGPIALVEFEFIVVSGQELFLQTASVVHESAVEDLDPAKICLVLYEGTKCRIVGPVATLEGGGLAGYFAL